MKTMIAVSSLLSAMAAGLCASPSALALSCGDEVTRSVTLTEDLVDCPENALRVQGRNGIEINLNGHTVSGVKGSDYAAIMVVESKGVRIIGGTITGFASGVAVNYSSYTTIDNVHFDGLGEGIYLLGARTTRIRHSRFSDNFSGISMDSEGNSSGNEVLNNDFSENSQGVFLRNANDNRVSHNTFRNNTSAIGLTSSSANEVIGNGIYNNANGLSIAQDGPAAAGANSNLIQGNKFYNNNLGLTLYVPTGHAQYNKYNRVERNAFRGGVTGVDVSGARNYRTIIQANSFYGMSDRAVDDRGTRTELITNTCSDSSC